MFNRLFAFFIISSFCTLSFASSGFIEKEMLFSKARIVLVKNNWKPTPMHTNDNWNYVGVERDLVSSNIIEVDSCAVDIALCVLFYNKNEECLKLIVKGEDIKTMKVVQWTFECPESRTLAGDGGQEYNQAKGIEEAKYLLQKHRMILLIPSSPPVEWIYQIRAKEYAKYGIEWKLVGDAPSSGYEEYQEAFNKVMSDSIVSKYGQDFFDRTEKQISLKTAEEESRRNKFSVVK